MPTDIWAPTVGHQRAQVRPRSGRPAKHRPRGGTVMDETYESAGAPSTGRGAARSESRYEEEPAGGGWVAFAGVMIAIVGVLNIIYGIAAISNSRFFVHGT